MGKTGISTELTGVQVVELVEYAGGGEDTIGFTYDEKEQVPLEDVATEDDDEDIPF